MTSQRWQGKSNQGGLEPLAIIGIGCRFPGSANDPHRYWQLLDQGVDAISETPQNRWNLQKFYAPDTTRPGKTQSKWGGYVSDIDRFDPQLFGISPREAASMDPQQRMLLEVAYRATEDAGQPLSALTGAPVAVYVGISSFDYAVAGLSFRDRGVISPYSNTGGSSSIAANRISYCFDLRGPSVAVDTACSSSLVAVHMACESIWRGDAQMALAGGVNALLLPDFYVAFSQLGVLSADGRCKTFDSRANGYVRSEGAGMIMLKPLSAALRDRDAIYAVIRSTALNQDGRTPGMTVPSQAAQERLIRNACAKAAIQPREIQYVEAHGTGTPVGDPIEARALGSVLGRDRETPCMVGSVKTNIGHLEAGAGIASVIKVALAMQQKRIPAHLHLESPNPDIDFDALNLRVPLQSCDWDTDSPRLAGVNGFGYGGANAHVILQEAPALASPGVYIPTTSDAEQSGTSDAGETLSAAPVLLPLSARNKSAVLQSAVQMADWIDANPHCHIAEVAGFLAHRRSHHDYRLTVCAHDRSDLVAELRSVAASTPEEFAEDFGAGNLALDPFFVCSGQGPQWWAMGRQLLKYSPAFRSTIRRCDEEMSKYAKWSLLEELSRSESSSRMQKTSIAQPCIFAIQVALAAVWESWGIKPAAIVGHSVGEIASAYLSGALSWEDACLVAFHRGRTMDLASSQGAMVAAGIAANEVPQWISGFEDQVGVAAINGPSSVTISGHRDGIEEVAQRLEDAGIFCRRLAVEYAFHSPQMEPVRDELLRSLASIRPRVTHTPLVSTVTGTMIEGTEVGPEYWWKNVRQAVRFSDAMQYLADQNFSVAVEVGPHPVLAYAINECFQTAGKSVRSVSSLNRQQDDLQCMAKSLGSLYALGMNIDWHGFYNKPTRKLPLPGYPFQLQQCWSESLESQLTRMADLPHPLLGEATMDSQDAWQSRIDLRLHPFLRGHQVRGACVYPAAATIEMVLAAAHQNAELSSVRFERVRMHSPCTLSDERPQWIETRFNPSRQEYCLAVRDCEETEWSDLATIRLSQATQVDVGSIEKEFSEAADRIQERCHEYFDSQRLYEYCGRLGLNYSGQFQGIVDGWCRAGEALVHVRLPDDDGGVDVSAFHIHPALLDSCFQSMIASDPNFDHSIDGLFLPIELKEFHFHRSPTQEVTVHCRLISKTDKHLKCDLDIFDEHGQLCVSIREFTSVRVAGGPQLEQTEDLIYGYSWLPTPLAPGAAAEPGTPQNWLVFMDENGTGRELTERLSRRGDHVICVYRQDSQVAQSALPFHQVDPTDSQAFDRLLQDCGIEETPVDHIVYLWGLDAPAPENLSTEPLRKSCQLTTLAPLYFVQAWDRVVEESSASLAVVTSGAQSQDGIAEATQVAQGPLVGFARVIVSEFAKLNSKLVDLPHPIASSDVDLLIQELLADDQEDEILWRDRERFAHRFTPQPGKPAEEVARERLACQLQVGENSGIEELRYATKPNRPLQPGQVEIEVAATGLNFSDVMKALDLYPGLPDGPVDLGAECCGRISRIADGSQFEVGQEVIAVAPGSFGTKVTVNEALVARKPANLTAEQAAALPIAFLTADYAMNQCARLQHGESILIHSASGGVGLAAMQLAKLSGIEVLATAGTPEKREYVTRQGAAHTMDSRSLDFGDQTLEFTNGQGVDAVLNSLPGEAISKGLSTLKTGGRFLEIGKRDIYGDAALGLLPFRNNLALFAIDLDQLFKQQPERLGNMLRALVERFESGELKPLPVTCFEADETSAAFRYMQQGKHIGKVVVRYAQAPSDIVNGACDVLELDGDATYWVVGGLGGFGLEITRWMINRGARHLVLSGRSQSLRLEAEKALAEFSSAGASVTVIPADITELAEVDRVLETIDRDLPPLKGVIHTAMILEDKLLVDLDRKTLDRVLWPKVLGGWNLHQATQRYDLDYFVLFSSLSSVFGHAGQANYSAANALLDSLAYYRRSQDQPATVMNWGHLGEVGYLAEREQLGQRLERQGVLSFTVNQATDCLEYALQHFAIQLSVLRMDWSLWRGLGITNRVSPRFADLLVDAGGASDSGADMANGASLREAPPQRRLELVDQMLRNKAGQLLGIPAEQIPSDRALLELGLDSLMAVEMRNWLENQMEINLPISVLMRSGSLADVTAAISDIIADSDAVIATAPVASESTEATEQSHDALTGEDAQKLLEELPDLSSEQVSELLSQMLKDK